MSAASHLRAFEPRRIVIFRALFLGDLMLSVPAFRALRRRFPNAEITLIGLPWARELAGRYRSYIDRFVEFAGYPGILEVEVDPERTARFMEEQHAHGYDLAIQMHGDGNVTNGLVAELGAPVTLGYAHEGDARLTVSLPYDPEEHELLRWLRLVSLLGAPTGDTSVEFPIYPADELAASELLSELPHGSGPVIGVHPGAKVASRRWPAERFAELADRLVERLDARVLLTGADGERGLTASVARLARRPVLDLGGRTELGALAAVMSRLDLLVTNDTGVSHVAPATRTPSVVLFATSRPEQWGPLDSELHRPVEPTRLGLTIAELPVETVYGECEQMLRRTSAPAGSTRELEEAASR